MTTMTEEEARLVASFKAQMAPQIDEALVAFLRNMTTQLQTVAESELARCISIVEVCRMTKPSPIGPLHTAGWNEAIDFALKQLRSWKTYADSEPSEATSTEKEGA